MIPLDQAVTHHLATAAAPLPAAGIQQWIIAQNGVFKRGCTAQLELMIQVTHAAMPMPGLINLMPQLRWPQQQRQRLPGGLLAPILTAARAACQQQAVEDQIFIVADGPAVKAVRPPQQRTATSVIYTMPQGRTILCDIHSHHGMAAYFSGTDNRDDQGLSISAVLGRIATRPEIVVRLNVWGHHQIVPALMVFDDLGPFVDAGLTGGTDADAHT